MFKNLSNSISEAYTEEEKRKFNLPIDNLFNQDFFALSKEIQDEKINHHLNSYLELFHDDEMPVEQDVQKFKDYSAQIIELKNSSLLNKFFTLFGHQHFYDLISHEESLTIDNLVTMINDTFQKSERKYQDSLVKPSKEFLEWDTSKSEDMRIIFENCTFNTNINGWNPNTPERLVAPFDHPSKNDIEISSNSVLEKILDNRNEKSDKKTHKPK